MRILFFLAATLLPAVSLAQSFRGIGDLPGGNHLSSISGISADGTRAVGFSATAEGFEAFVWTEANGIVGLGDLAGGDRVSYANEISVVGYRNQSSSSIVT